MILFAEDEFTSRKLMEVHMKKNQLPFESMENGQAVLESLNTDRQYSLYILDEYMPGYNGSELVPLIKQKFPSIPVLGITSDNGALNHLKQAGFDYVFMKPLRGDKFISVIKEFL